MSSPPPNTALQRHFITIRGEFGTRQVHYRRGGAGPVLLLLHQSPQSSREMEPLILAWGQSCTVIAPDSPGYGLSQPLQRAGQPVTSASIDEFAAATLEFATALGLQRFGIYGFHTGASIAVALADRYPSRVTAVAANGLVVLTAEERAAILRDYLPAFVPQWDGSHLAWLWARMREQTIFFPWHDRRAATRMTFDVPPPERLQEGLQEFLAAGAGYHVAYGAAFSDRAESRLPTLSVPLLITATARDPLSGHLGRIGARSARVQVEPSADSSAALSRSFAHLARHPGDAGPPSAPAAGASVYLGSPGQQVRVIRHAAQAGGPDQTVILLHPPAASGEALHGLAAELAAYAEVLAVDLPGHGASDHPLADGAGSVLAGAVRQLTEALQPLLTSQGSVVLALGSSAPVGVELATALGPLTRLILLSPPTWSPADAAAWRRHGLPPLTPVWAGGHLLEAWHLVRDSRLFAPWFRRESAGIRPGEPELDEVGIHREVQDLLRANGTWQALLRDVLDYDGGRGGPDRPAVITLTEAPGNWGYILSPGRTPTPHPS